MELKIKHLIGIMVILVIVLALVNMAEAAPAPVITSASDVATLTPGKALNQTITCSVPAGSSAVSKFVLSIPVPSGASLASATGSKGSVTQQLSATWTDSNSGASGSSVLNVTWPVTLLVPNPVSGTITVNVGQLDPGGDAAIIKIGWQF